MLLRLFIIFYNTELVDEDVFLQWKEDINETYPGKGKSLFQVSYSSFVVVSVAFFIGNFGIFHRHVYY